MEKSRTIKREKEENMMINKEEETGKKTGRVRRRGGR